MVEEKEKKEERAYIERIAKSMFTSRSVAPPSPAAPAPAEPEAKEGKIAEKLVYAKVRQLESEHKSKIGIYTNKISRLREDQEKLKNVIEILRGLNLAIPEEYNLKHRQIMEEEKVSQAEVEKEKIFLNYLQSRILPLIE